MNKALIGYTGFVGSNLMNQTHFNHLFNSSNLKEITHNEYKIVVCAAPSGVKWKVNQNPEEDYNNILDMIETIKNVKTDLFVYVSTVDVYSAPINVNEGTNIEETLNTLHPYGKHRFLLEESIRKNFPDNHIIVRPATIFGPNLKKNIIFDFAHNNALDFTHSESKFQFYPVVNLWRDIQILSESKIKTANLISEQITPKEIAKECFNFNFENITEKGPLEYLIKTKYSINFNKTGDFIYTKDEIFFFIGEYLKTLSKS